MSNFEKKLKKIIEDNTIAGDSDGFMVTLYEYELRDLISQAKREAKREVVKEINDYVEHELSFGYDQRLRNIKDLINEIQREKVDVFKHTKDIEKPKKVKFNLQNKEIEEKIE